MSIVAIRSVLPLAAGQKVGLLGGSFDPPHLGHVHIAKVAKRKFGLDRVIWLVSPGNPLKAHAPAPLVQRLQACSDILGQTPYYTASDVETVLETRYTAETLSMLRQAHRDVSFTWLMGADNLRQFHKWENWKNIARTVPIGVVARPEQRVAARHSIAAKIFRFARLPERASHTLGAQTAPSWCFVNCPMVNLSSTELRAAAAPQNGN